MKEDSILILGGCGFLGQALCAALVARSGAARAVVPTRRAPHARQVQSLPGIEIVEADVHDDATLRRLVAGRSAVVNLIGILHGNEAAFRKAHVDLPRRVGAAAVAAGCRRMVHISALGNDPQAPSEYLRSKAAGEAAVRDSGTEWTILRPSLMFGSGDRLLNLFAGLQRVAPLLPLAGADAKVQPVWVCDVAQAIVRCLDDRSTIGETIECTGPRAMTLGELAQLAGRWSGHPRKIWRVPDGLARVEAALIEALPGEPLLSRDNLASLKVPNVATGKLPGLERLGITPAALEAVAPQYLSPTPGRARLDVWRALARR